MSTQITVTKSEVLKTKPDEKNLGFGQFFTDHMFVMDYSDEKGWYGSRIVPYGPLSVDPSTMVLHYGQAIFEGLKAYKTKKGKILLLKN